MDSGNQATGGSSMTTTDGDKDDDLLLTSIFHFKEEINKKRIGNIIGHNSLLWIILH